MLAVYGRMRRIAEKAFGEKDLSPLSGSELIDVLESGELGVITTVTLFGTDYAAVGAVQARLRKALDSVNVPVIIVAESETLLSSKKPNNPKAVVLVERSKKPEVLKALIERYIVWDMDLDTPKEPEIVMPELESPAPTELMQISGVDTPSDIEAVEQEMVTVDITEPRIEVTPAVASEPTVISIAKPLYSWDVCELPKYAPMIFEEPEHVLEHLSRKWGLDVVR